MIPLVSLQLLAILFSPTGTFFTSPGCKHSNRSQQCGEHFSDADMNGREWLISETRGLKYENLLVLFEIRSDVG